MNLWVNAIQAMPEGGSLEVRADLSNEETGGSPRVSISFQDTGVGISSQDLPRVFDPFFTSKAPGEGSGLGLTIAKGIVLAHGGRMEAHSDGAGGSLFKVFLPVRELGHGDA
jgi:signal transduction histidine kinase